MDRGQIKIQIEGSKQKDQNETENILEEEVEVTR